MRPDGLRQRRMVARAALVGIIVLSAVPITAPFTAWLLPAPLMAATARERPWAACAACAALIVGGFSWSAPLFALAAYFLGWVAGDAIRRSESVYVSLITGTLTFIMLELVQLAFLRAHGLDIGQELARWVSLSSPARTSYFGGGLAPENLSAMLTQSVHLMLPAALCIMAVVLSALNLTAGRALLGRVGEGSPSLLANWRLPVWVALVYMLSLPLLWFVSYQNAPVWWQCINTVAVVSGFLIGVQGVAYLWRRVSRWRGRYVWLVLMVAVVPVIPFAANVYVMFGLIDMLSGLRRP